LDLSQQASQMNRANFFVGFQQTGGNVFDLIIRHKLFDFKRRKISARGISNSKNLKQKTPRKRQMNLRLGTLTTKPPLSRIENLRTTTISEKQHTHISYYYAKPRTISK